MSFAEPTEAQHESPLPDELDVGLYLLCVTAAMRFVVCRSADYPAVSVTFEVPGRQWRRLPCEWLWVLP